MKKQLAVFAASIFALAACGGGEDPAATTTALSTADNAAQFVVSYDSVQSTLGATASNSSQAKSGAPAGSYPSKATVTQPCDSGSITYTTDDSTVFREDGTYVSSSCTYSSSESGSTTTLNSKGIRPSTAQSIHNAVAEIKAPATGGAPDVADLVAARQSVKGLLGSPDANKAMYALEAAIAKLGIEHSLIELIRLRASQINGCAFCVDMHTSDARKAFEGVSIGPLITHLNGVDGRDIEAEALEALARAEDQPRRSGVARQLANNPLTLVRRRDFKFVGCEVHRPIVA